MTTIASRSSTLPEGWPEFTLGPWAEHWAESWLVQPNGPRAGELLELTEGQRRFLWWWYAVDEDGRWRFNHGARRLAKGSGKSPFAAVLALVELCAPVRLLHLDRAKKDPRLERWGWTVGRPVDMPWVQIAATSQDQTTNTMRMVRAFAPRGSPVVEAHGLDPGKQTYYKQPEGALQVITSSSTAAEGAEASFVVADETEYWTPSNGGVDLAATLADNLAKSGSRMLETSNAWVPGQGSVAEWTWDAWTAAEEGRTTGDTRILYDAVIAPPDTDMRDDDSLRAALEHVYADCWWQDIEPIVQRIRSLNSRPEDSKRKYLNWPSVAADAWVEPEEWSALADATVTVADGDEIVAFFDGSKSEDATALVGCRVEDGHVFTLGVWEPDPGDPDDQVDAADVDRVVQQMFDRFDVAAFFADVKEWESFALADWPGRYGDEVRLWAAPKSRPPQPIAWDMRGHRLEFAKAVEACHAEIVEGQFTHDGDSRVARHVANARRRVYQDAITIRKESPNSRRKIDAAVCVVGARMLRRMWLQSGKRRAKTGRAMFA